MPNFPPPPPSGADRHGSELPEAWVASWENLSAPEQLWFQFRGRSFLAQFILWMLLSPIIILLWTTKNFTSQTSSTGIKVFSGILIAMMILSFVS